VELLEALRGTERTLSVRRPGPCQACRGTGAGEDGFPCSACGGSGSVETAARLRATIPAGVSTGARVRLEGQGGSGRGGAPPGDLWLVMRVADHPLFGRVGDDLTIDVPITVAEAVRGGTLAIPTPEGSVKLRIPPRTQSGRRLRLRGKGAPRLDGGPRGDLLARVLIQIPESGAGLEAIAESLEPLNGSSLRNRFGG
jgi:molecular chaperone DnaJ